MKMMKIQEKLVNLLLPSAVSENYQVETEYIFTDQRKAIKIPRFTLKINCPIKRGQRGCPYKSGDPGVSVYLSYKSYLTGF